ncbi:suppressor protein SRP40-like isoform X2 [Malania oleifera]|uniref:suppressor protein SRP40-like isoform X2 n=1 Tax=Malania oleifera TaxID=397392 RepID=UPI0025ADDE51|nr:suppressor protein SRP40-like isoform X2 [Malania oleifera]
MKNRARHLITTDDEFKPASIDKNQPGSLHKNKENRVSVEFHNNQHGKPKVTFEGSSEDYKENDAVLFFDGETFRLERLHRAVKRLRHVRLPGESTAIASTAAATSVGLPAESCSSPIGKGAKVHSSNKSTFHPPPVEVERIDIGDSESLGAKPKNERTVDYPSGRPNPPAASPDAKNFDLEEPLEIVNDDEDVCRTSDKGVSAEKEFHTGIDINLPHQNDTDDEIAEVDVSDDELDKGRNAAEALRAQVSAEGKEEHTSSSGGSSGSESSGSGSGSGSGSDSGSSSSDSESSDSDSVNSI